MTAHSHRAKQAGDTKSHVARVPGSLTLTIECLGPGTPRESQRHCCCLSSWGFSGLSLRRCKSVRKVSLVPLTEDHGPATHLSTPRFILSLTLSARYKLTESSSPKSPPSGHAESSRQSARLVQAPNRAWLLRTRPCRGCLPLPHPHTTQDRWGCIYRASWACLVCFKSQA